MRRTIPLLLLIPSLALGQRAQVLSDSVRLEMRSVDAAHVLQVDIALAGGLLRRVGVLRPAPGIIEMKGPRGDATTPAVLDLGTAPGELILTVSTGGPELEIVIMSRTEADRRWIARGHSIRFNREHDGRLVVSASRVETRFQQ